MIVGHDQHVRATGKVLQDLLTEEHPMSLDHGWPLGDRGQPQFVHLLGTGVDEVQPHL